MSHRYVSPEIGRFQRFTSRNNQLSKVTNENGGDIHHLPDCEVYLVEQWVASPSRFYETVVVPSPGSKGVNVAVIELSSSATEKQAVFVDSLFTNTNVLDKGLEARTCHLGTIVIAPSREMMEDLGLTLVKIQSGDFESEFEARRLRTFLRRLSLLSQPRSADDPQTSLDVTADELKGYFSFACTASDIFEAVHALVVDIQNRLAWLHHYPAFAGRDGVLGELTMLSIRKFQLAWNDDVKQKPFDPSVPILRSDGIVDAPTYESICGTFSSRVMIMRKTAEKLGLSLAWELPQAFEGTTTPQAAVEEDSIQKVDAHGEAEIKLCLHADSLSKSIKETQKALGLPADGVMGMTTMTKALASLQ